MFDFKAWFKDWDRYSPQLRARYRPEAAPGEPPFFEEMYQAFKARMLEEQSSNKSGAEK